MSEDFTVKTTTRSIGMAVVGMLVGVLIVMMLVMMTKTWDLASSIRQQQKANAPVLESTHQSAYSTAQLLKLFTSCTTRGQPCFKQSAEATAKIKAEINRITVYAAYCSSQNPGDLPAIQSCVHRLRKQEQ